jgi:hypothetical protein
VRVYLRPRPVLDSVSVPGFSLSLRLRARSVNNVSDASIGLYHNIRSCGLRMSAGTVQASHSLRLSPLRIDWPGPHRLPSVRADEFLDKTRRLAPWIIAEALGWVSRCVFVAEIANRA